MSKWAEQLTVRTWLPGGAVLTVFVAGVAVRLLGLTQPPLDFHPTRQLHSAEIARGFYYATHPDAPDWQRAFALEGRLRRGVIEPQVMESVSAWAFGLLGGEELWFPRLLSITFWTLGAWFLHLTARRWAGRLGGLVAAGYMLFSPYALQASRAFMPDPLMVCLMCGTLWAATRWVSERPGPGAWWWAAATGAFAGAALFVKPAAGYFLGPFLAALVLRHFGLRSLRTPQVWVAGLLAVLPLTGYLTATSALGLEVLGMGGRVFPELWASSSFYLNWAGMLTIVLGTGWLLAGLLGTLLIPQGAAVVGLIGWYVGYVALGFTVSHHMSTHDYYSLPLVPVVGLGLGVLVGVARRSVSRTRRALRATIAGLVAVTMVVGGLAGWSRLGAIDHQQEARNWQLLGSLFAPTDRIVGLTAHYGHLFTYFGWRSYTWWPATFDRALMPETNDFPSYWVTRTAGMDYFLLTDFGQWDAQPDVREHVLQHCTVVSRTNWYVIFDLRDSAECQQPAERP